CVGSTPATTRTAAACAVYARRDAAVFHHDDHGPGLPLRDQVIEDEVCAALVRPRAAILPHSVLQIQDGIPSRRIPVVTRRRIDVHETILSVGFPFEPMSTDF